MLSVFNFSDRILILIQIIFEKKSIQIQGL